MQWSQTPGQLPGVIRACDTTSRVDLETLVAAVVQGMPPAVKSRSLVDVILQMFPL